MAVFPIELWAGFIIFITTALAIDLGVLHKKARTPSFKEASIMSSIWVSSALIFCLIIYSYTGSQRATEFITGYVIELSLSMDNIFVFIMIFTYFKVPLKYQHRVLFWGVAGAIVMRFIMIMGGIYLVHYFEWLFFILGAFLIYTGYQIASSNHDTNEVISHKKNVINFLQKFLPISNKFDEEKFFTIEKGKRLATPLFVVLITIEKTDLVFALDSIPAILAITKEPFIVFSSNIFAILGLRSMYFLLATIIHKFRFLKYGIACILIIVGLKMIFSLFGYKLDTIVTLLIIITILSTSILSSLLTPESKKPS